MIKAKLHITTSVLRFADVVLCVAKGRFRCSKKLGG